VAAGDAEPGQLGDQGGAQFLKVTGGDEPVPGLAYRLVALLGEHVPVLAEALGPLGDQQLHPQPQVFDETNVGQAGVGERAQPDQRPPPPGRLAAGAGTGTDVLVEEREKPGLGAACGVVEEGRHKPRRPVVRQA
jgi:hypothetical protein